MQENVQLTHEEHRQSNNKFPLYLVANDINDPLNVGGLFRISDALGIEKLYLCGGTPAPPNTKIKRTSRSTEKDVEFEYHTDAEALVTALKSSGVLIVSLEITSSSISISSEEFTKMMRSNKPICLILGSENTGVSDNLLSLSDVIIHIPMFGNNSSMNIVSASSIACFEITKLINSDNHIHT